MSRETVLDNAKKLYTTKNEVVRAFESGVFPYKNGFWTEPKSEWGIVEKTKLRKQRLDEMAKIEKTINLNLFKKLVNYLSPSDMYKALNKIKKPRRK